MSDAQTHCEGHPQQWRASPAWLLVPILLVGAWWRTRWLSEISYWFDESFCLKMAEFPVSEISDRCASDTHPPFYFLLLKAWGAVFGTSPIAARGLSVVCGLATIVGTYLFVRDAYRPAEKGGQGSNGGWRMEDRRSRCVSPNFSTNADAGDSSRSQWAALAAAALVALSPIQIEWSLMVRMYAPLATLAVFSAWFLMRALHAVSYSAITAAKDGRRDACTTIHDAAAIQDTPTTIQPAAAAPRPSSRWLDWTLFTITAILLIYTHHFGLFTLAAELSFAGIYVWRSDCQWTTVASRGAADNETFPEPRLSGGEGVPPLTDGRGSLESGRGSIENRRRAGRFDFSRVRPLLISTGVIAAAWSLWAGSFLEQRQRVVDNFWSRSLDWDGIGTIFFQLFGVHEWEPGSAFAGLVMAQAAVIGILLVLARGRPGDLLVALAASLPFVAAIGFSLLGRNIFFTRYLLAGHLFLLIAGAVLLSRVPLWPLRLLTILLAVGGMSCLSWKHCERRQGLARLPGMQGAIARFEEARQADEPLIVCNPMLYTSVLAYSRHRDDCFVDGAEYPFFHGTAALRAAEYFPRARFADGSCRIVWTLDANQWHGSNWAVPMPRGWKAVGDWRFQEYYCGELVLRMYERENAVAQSE